MNIFIVIPYHNAEPWLKRCLDSIDSRFKVITVNDFSTDGSPEIARGYYLDSKTLIDARTLTRGVGAARSTGMWFAIEEGADYIAFLDADDELAPDAYDSMIASIREKPQAEIIQFQHRRVMPDGKTAPRFPCRKGVYFPDNLPPLWVSSVNKVFKAPLLRKVDFDITLRHGEDEVFILNCLKSARYIFVSDYVTMLYHKDNPNSLSQVTTFDDLLGEQRALLLFLEEHNGDRELCEAVRKRQVELWNNPTYRRIIGGAK